MVDSNACPASAVTDNMIDPFTMSGSAIVILAIVGYAYVGFQLKQPARAKTSDLDTKKEPLAETTPLTAPEKAPEHSSLPLVAVGICAACVAIIAAAVVIPLVIIHNNASPDSSSNSTMLLS